MENKIVRQEELAELVKLQKEYIDSKFNNIDIPEFDTSGLVTKEEAEDTYAKKSDLEDSIIKVTDNDFSVKEIYIEDSIEEIEAPTIYTSEQVDDKIEQVNAHSQYLAWETMQDILPVLPEFYSKVLPEIKGHKIRIMSIEDYFSLIPDENIYYVVYDLKDYTIYAVYKDREAVWESRDRTNLLKGRYISGVTSVNWTYTEGTSTTKKTIAIESDENGYFEHDFGMQVNNVLCSTNNSLRGIAQWPKVSINNTSPIGALANTNNNHDKPQWVNVEYVNLDGYRGSEISEFQCAFKDNLKIKAIDLTDIRLDKTTNGQGCRIGGCFQGAKALKYVKFGKDNRLENVSFAFTYNSSLEELDLSDLELVLDTEWSWCFINYYDENGGLFNGKDILKKLKLPKSVTLPKYSKYNCTWNSGFINTFSKYITGKWDLSCFDPSFFKNSNWLDGAFANNPGIEEIDMSTSVINGYTEEIEYIFKDNESMHTLRLGDWDLSKINEAWRIEDWFKNCKSLQNLTGNIYNIKGSFSFEDCPLLTDESIEVILNMPANVTTQETLTFHPDVFARLTPEQLASVTAKGWTVVSA